MAIVKRNPTGIASKKNQRKDGSVNPTSRMNIVAIEGTGSGKRRGQGTQMPKATAIPRAPASGAASARKASLGHGMKEDGHLVAREGSRPMNHPFFVAK